MHCICGILINILHILQIALPFDSAVCGWLYEGLVPKGATFRLFEGHTLFLSDMMGFPRRIHTYTGGFGKWSFEGCATRDLDRTMNLVVDVAKILLL